jgi:predicted DNA-binding transcriptional regulator YafY
VLVPTAKAERLLDLVIALLNAPRFRTAAWIREHVAGYGDAVSDEAFSRMFERDKQELRDLGIPIQTVGGSGDGYRILPGELELPPMSFTPAEAAALAMAGRLWDTTLLADAGFAALRKIRDASEGADEVASGPVSVLQARVRTSEPAFSPLYAAVRARRAVRFDYRKADGSPVLTRSLEPWGLVSFRGAWYVVGRDTDREAMRTFRLSRIAGEVEAVGPAGTVQVPEGVDLQASLREDDNDAPVRSALLRIRPGVGAGLRRGGELLALAGDGNGFDEVRVPVESYWDVARRIAANGPDIVVVDPPDLRDAVIGLLTGASRTATGGDPS